MDSLTKPLQENHTRGAACTARMVRGELHILATLDPTAAHLSLLPLAGPHWLRRLVVLMCAHEQAPKQADKQKSARRCLWDGQKDASRLGTGDAASTPPPAPPPPPPQQPLFCAGCGETNSDHCVSYQKVPCIWFCPSGFSTSDNQYNHRFHPPRFQLMHTLHCHFEIQVTAPVQYPHGAPGRTVKSGRSCSQRRILGLTHALHRPCKKGREPVRNGCGTMLTTI